MNADDLFSGRDETVINAIREDFARILGHGKEKEERKIRDAGEINPPALGLFHHDLLENASIYHP